MGRLTIEAVVPGQTASRPVTNTNGMVLVQAGTVLTASLIERLKTLGVASVVVAGTDGAGRGGSSEEQVAAIEHRFMGHEDNEIMMKIRDMVLAQVQGGR